MVPYIREQEDLADSPRTSCTTRVADAQASLLFAGLALGRPEYIALWKTLPADSNVEEVVRNFFIRQPVLWLDAERAALRSAATREGGFRGEPTALRWSVRP